TVSDSIAAPWSWELTSREYPIYPPTPESCYLIGGSTGSLSVPDLRLWSHSGGAPDWWTPIAASSLTRAASDPLVNQMAHFASVVRGETAPLVSGREGLRTLQVIEAIQKAGETGLVQHINDLQVTEKYKENEGV
ncbi:MAG: gfo/Idh/MocA family oxidoreductase, partial [Pseudomonadota bacterium]|nr:gfo/Idh/MocA family oxidoreductase [Pseudomonadota bacterium]